MAIKVTIWNEYVHEKGDDKQGAYIRQFYPQGIHKALKDELSADDLEIRAVSLDQPDQGLPDELLNDTDVLMWWGHCAHDKVDDGLVNRIQRRIHNGMGLIVLHSGHYSKIFRKMLGTPCSLLWRDIAEKERVWTVCPGHPIAKGVPSSFALPHTEMYGEPFDIPDDGKIIFSSWYEGGNVFRSGVLFQRRNGKIFYFSPGHEMYPIYHDPNVVRILGNAIRFVAPAEYLPNPGSDAHKPEPLEPVTTENILKLV